MKRFDEARLSAISVLSGVEQGRKELGLWETDLHSNGLILFSAESYS